MNQCWTGRYFQAAWAIQADFWKILALPSGKVGSLDLIPHTDIVLLAAGYQPEVEGATAISNTIGPSPPNRFDIRIVTFIFLSSLNFKVSSVSVDGLETSQVCFYAGLLSSRKDAGMTELRLLGV
jgi:hypothetical protein